MPKTPTLSLPSRLPALRRGLLLGLLGVLYLVLWQRPDTLLGKTLFLVHLGLFMLWQPFVHTEQRLSGRALTLIVVAVVLAALGVRGWLLATWIMMLAGIVGGKVLLFGERSERAFYLLALGFLVMALLLLAAPMAAPMIRLPPQIATLAFWVLPAALGVMALLPRGREESPSAEVVDFVYSLFVFLLLAVLMLGSLAAMLMFDSGYVEALLQVLLLMGVVLLVLGWAWNPHAGFSGLGNLFSRYMMSIGLPVEQWLAALADLALRETDPERFVEQACADMARRLPWVRGGEWAAGGREGRFGQADGKRSEFAHEGLVLALYTRHPLSPTLNWHFNLLAQLLAEFHADKRRAQALKELSYMQAIHETGARLTHDVKNLLQSLNALCAAVAEPGAEASPAYRALLQRQLPAISARLGETLAKLRVPQESALAGRQAAGRWWADLQQRVAGYAWLQLDGAPAEDAWIPGEAFSGVVENLIHNAEEKRLREPALGLRIHWEHGPLGGELVVCDNGSAVAEELARRLTVTPVPSESGLGIGLYQAARYAEACGYQLRLEENRPGRVCFRLAPTA